jgi:hypothetical protein
MRPLLIVEDRELEAVGGWDASARGHWRIGALQVKAQGRPVPGDDALEMILAVEGAPPKEPYELRWLFDLPWDKVTWRGESGGGFVTPGPVEAGGDSLLGITGSIFACGEGLSVAPASGAGGLDLSFDQTGLCGLGGRTTRAAQGTYGERLEPEIARLSVWDSTCTQGRLEWYLLATAQNHREALLDQGGARRWSFRCTLRRRAGTFDDASLYRFARGQNTPAELVDPDGWPHDGPWLAVKGGEGVLLLGAYRADEGTCVDLYNTLPESVSLVLGGSAVEGRSTHRADMLGRALGVCPDGRIEIDPLAYLKVVLP